MDIQNKINSYVVLVEMMRDTQREFFVASKQRDYNKKNELIKKAKALESRVDAETTELKELLKTGFQPELFR